MHGEHVVGVVVHLEALATLRGLVEIALHLAAERILHGLGKSGELRRQLVDVVEHHGGALLHVALDLRRIGHGGTGDRRLYAGELGRRDRLLVEDEQQPGRVPKRVDGEQALEDRPVHDRHELVGATLDVHGPLAEIVAAKGFGTERRHDLVERHVARLQHNVRARLQRNVRRSAAGARPASATTSRPDCSGRARGRSRRRPRHQWRATAPAAPPWASAAASCRGSRHTSPPRGSPAPDTSSSSRPRASNAARRSGHSHSRSLWKGR